tara:strand:- start:256 stop:429 length:174 start_codon:yes stop_codon:yes gene_type:complete
MAFTSEVIVSGILVVGLLIVNLRMKHPTVRLILHILVLVCVADAYLLTRHHRRVSTS